MTKVDEAADFLLSFDPETIDSPYLPNINLGHLIKTGAVKVRQLKEERSADEAKQLVKDDIRPKEEWVRERISVSTLGIAPNGEKAFLYLNRDFALVDPVNEIAAALEGLNALRWDKADNSNRKCLRDSHGYELHFGWRDNFGKMILYVPTITQTEHYMKMWPLLDKMEGIYARSMPQVWGDANLAKQMAEDFAHTAEGQKGRSTFGAIQVLKNAPSKLHLDPGNQKKSMSVLTTCGDYQGGDFLFYQYGVGIPIKPGDVLIARTHEEWHCNVGEVDGTRYSIIAYAREPKP